MGTGIYKTVNNKRVEVSAKEAKATIMDIYNFTTEEYNKFYDITRNQVRAHEAVTGATEKESIVKFLYAEAKAKKRYGAEYRPSAHVAAVRGTSAISSGKALQKAIKNKQSGFYKAQQKLAKSEVERFSALISTNPKAAEIDKAIQDPIKELAALKAFAKEMHTKIDEDGQAAAAQAIPYGDTAGSPDAAGDFDYSAWLDKEDK